MWYGYVEADSGEALRLVLPTGRFGGKALLAFLTALSDYFYHTTQDEKRLSDAIQWFNILDKHPTKPLTEILAPIENAYYAGDWSDYRLDEWEFFIKRNRLNISQYEFEQAVVGIQEKWTLTDKLLKSVTWLLETLQSNDFQTIDWYNPSDTIPEFQSLQHALILLKERKAKTVRIKFLM